MKHNSPDMLCFSSIELDWPVIHNKTIKSKVKLNKIEGEKVEFNLLLKYQYPLKEKHLPVLSLAYIMPLLNYGLFSESIKLNFSLDKSDIDLLEELNKIFSKDIFVNKILRRRANYILPNYLPDKKEINLDDAEPKAVIEPIRITKDKMISTTIDGYRCGILSSGGKESLVTYGLLKEIGCNVYPLYVNESGGHWRTALSAYRYHNKIEPNTHRVWTNIDRFYNFMLDHLKFIRRDHRKVWADTYPIRLCIFPFYIFLFLPIFIDNRIGNLLIGSEFDDLRITPTYLGINHYYGIFDQHQDYDRIMNSWYTKRIPGIYQWSAVRNISGLIVERILVKRYPELAQLQRSCHSCHFKNNEIIPCGTCSKCMGVLLFLLANHDNPMIMNFDEDVIRSFPNTINPLDLRLDQDEKNHSLYLIGKQGIIPKVEPVDHVEKIHINKETCDINLVPNHIRSGLFDMIKEYTTGYCSLENEKWVSIDEIEIDN